MSNDDIQNILISSGITTGMYLGYKGVLNIYRNYYLESECHNSTLQISVKEREEQKEEQKDVELQEVKVDIIK